MATPAQIKMIHTLVGKLGLDDDTYREMLSRYGVSTSKRMGIADAADLIKALTRDAVQMGVWQPLTARPGRGRHYPSPKQIRMVEAMWSEVSRARSAGDRRKALDKFISHRFGVDKLAWLPRERVSQVVRALTAMRAQKSRKIDEQQPEPEKCCGNHQGHGRDVAVLGA